MGMNVAEELHLRRLIGTVPPQRRLQARVAVTGSAAEFAACVRGVVAESPADWQAHLSALYMIEFAALHREPAEVAELSREFQAGFGADVVLDAAAERRPAELAAIAAALPDPREFIGKAAQRRQPGDVAAMLAAMRQDIALMRTACGHACAHALPGKVAQVILHLRGMNAEEPLTELLTEMPRRSGAAGLGEFLAGLAGLGDDDSVRLCIARIVAWKDADPLGGETGTADAVDRVAAVVKSLLRKNCSQLADDVVESAIAEFALSGQQYRLYALVFLFRELELHDEVGRIADKISKGAEDDNIEMILRFCSENHDYAGALLQVVLKKPKPAAAVRFATELDPQHEIIFRTVATWPCEHLIRVFEDLWCTSDQLAREFREAVAEIAPQRSKGEEVGDIVLWFLGNPDDKQSMQHAHNIVAKIVELKQPGLLADLICKLRAGKGWWLGPHEKTVRDRAAQRVSEEYGIADMTALVGAAAGRCLPAVLWISADWLTRRPRSDAQVVQLIKALKDARCLPGELAKTIEWVAGRFRRVDGSTPMVALEKAGLMDERNVWFSVKRSMLPRFQRRPDPDKPHP